jgi:hypothetical protein
MFPKFRGIRQEKNERGDMNEDLRSILTGTAVLTVGAVVSLVLTILRPPQIVGREQTVRVFLLGLAVQSLHFLEEF